VGLQRLQQLPAAPVSGYPSQTPPNLLQVGELVLNRATYEVWYAGRLLALTPTEHSLLRALAEQAGAVMDYVSLTKAALAYEAEPWEAKELIKRHVYTLRQKLENEPDQPQVILNVRGVGYRLAT
jgi:DNA-binding response OmpR family regulator